MATRVYPNASQLPRRSAPRFLRRNARQLTSRVARPRFTLATAKDLLEYSHTTSVWRQVAVIVFFAVPSVVASFVAPLIPLEDPSLGFSKNPMYQLLLFATCFLTFFGVMPQVRAATAIPHDVCSDFDLVLIGLVSSAPLMGLGALVAATWRFPVPFFWVLFATPWLFCLAFGNAVVLRRHWHVVARPLVAYAPSLAVQIAQIIIYPAYSALFEAADDKSQVVLVALFPLLKLALKKGIFLLTQRSNRELASEIAVSSVEICSSMYQAIIMQTTPSLLATALLIGIDVLQGLYAVRCFVRDSAVLADADVMAMVAHAVKATPADGDSGLAHSGSRRTWRWPFTSARSARRLVRVGGARNVVTAVVPTIESREQRRKLTQALELLQSAETILLVEYLEVAVPMMNALFVAFATQFDSAIYNPRLRGFYRKPDELAAAISSVVLYTMLQALTLVAMAAALQFRLKIPALKLMAFVLEKHAWSLQGKLIPWLSVFFVFPITHFGVDFSFQFDFTTPSSA